MTNEPEDFVLRLLREIREDVRDVKKTLGAHETRLQRIERLTDESRELLHQVIGVSVIAGNRTEAYEARFDAFEARLAKLEARSEDA